ncbi:hypothetical protein ACFFKU_06815 [Kineococcus gynurae]|uniref:Gp28/Gp37-like domain-containing protein n=1 Tax=Kineococcus gynurae TaxID=452979 RepID=A0ABV5LWZ2_9ACTN
MGTWRLDVGPWTGAPVRQLTEARGISATFRLAGTSELSFTLNARRDQAAAVVPLVSDVHATRDRELIYTGRVGRPDDSPTATQHDRTFQTADYRGVLARQVWTGPQTTWTGEQAAVLKALVDHPQGLAGGNLGIDTSGLPTTGQSAARVTETGASIGTEIEALAAAGEPANAATAGFDWDVAPGWGAARKLRAWYPFRGSARPPLPYRWLEDPNRRESSRIRSATRSQDPAAFANAVLVTGGTKSVTTTSTTVNPSTGQTQVSTETKQVPTTPVFLAVADIATRPEGLWPQTISFGDITDQTELAAKAAERLAALAANLPAYEIVLAAGSWGGPSDVWLGDRVAVVVSSGVLAETVTLRVSEVRVQLDANGAETVTLVLGTPPGDLESALRGVFSRVATLELLA